MPEPRRPLVRVPSAWERPFEALRRKWSTIPQSDRRKQSPSLLRLSDDELLTLWRQQRDLDGPLERRGSYRLLYRDTVPGRRILDIGSSFAYDSLAFAEWGGHVTLVDIVEENVELVGRVARLLGVDGNGFRVLSGFRNNRVAFTPDWASATASVRVLSTCV